ncbi:MAG: hypothetical protein ACK4TA_01140 [Saprospiraceae bacterium]
MYNYITKIEVQGSKFTLLTSKFAFIVNSDGQDNLLLFDKQSLQLTELLTDFKYSFIFENKSEIYFVDTTSQLYKLSNSKKLTNNFYARKQVENGIVPIYRKIENGYKVLDTGLFDLSSEKVIFYKENLCSRYSVVNHDTVILEDFNFDSASAYELVCYSINTGEYVWSYNVADLGRYRRNSQSPEEEGKIEKIIGIYNDLLVVTITNFTVLAIDIHTGVLKGKWRDLPEGQSYGKSKRTTLVYPFQSFIDQTQGKLIGLIGSYYWEIDLYGDSIYLYDATEEFDKHQVGTQTSGQITPQGEHIFFASEYILPSAQRVQKVAAFNRSTKLIDWSYTFEDLAPTVMPKAPVVEGDRLYILDTGGTLHVFERKEVL